MSEREKNELIIANGSNGHIATMPVLFDPTAEHGRIWMSFDPSTDEGFLRMQAMQAGEQVPLATMAGKPFLLRHVMIEAKTDVSEETGEVIHWPRICLEAADGTVYSCGSNGIYRSLARLIMWKGAKGFDPPLKVVLNVKRLEKGKNFFELLYVAEEKPQQPKGGK